MNRFLHTTAVLLAALFIFAVYAPTTTAAVPPHTYVTCTAEAEGQPTSSSTVGENVPTEDVTAAEPPQTDESTAAAPDTVTDSATHDGSSLVSVIVAIIIAVALVVVIVALIPRKRQS